MFSAEMEIIDFYYQSFKSTTEELVNGFVY